MPSFRRRHRARFRGHAQGLRQLLSYVGPGFFVTIGFIDPGNWATNIAAGSHFGYDLLWVVALSTGVLTLWQHMSAHIGIVTGKCLAEATREHMRPPAVAFLGITAVAACIATALAEVLGAAIGLHLLFGISIQIGAILTTALVVGAIWFQRYVSLEKLMVGFVGAIGLCYLAEIHLVKPDWGAAAIHTIVPRLNSGSVFIAMGVLGAVVMPHNVYLHSEVIQNREWHGKTEPETRRLLRYEFIDTLVAMLAGMAINMAMVIVAAAVFHRNGVHVSELAQAAVTLKPLAGVLAGLLFGVALLFSGLSSSMTAGIAGGTTLSGYLGHETALDSRWFRAGMLLTLIPACVMVLFIHNDLRALILSQVCLSLQLPFTLLPLFLLTSSKRVMGAYASRSLENVLMMLSGLLIVFLNGLLVYSMFGGVF